MSCDHEDCDCKTPIDTRPKHWTDAVGHVTEVICVIAIFYFVTTCTMHVWAK